jgi:hypothetical protein
LSLAAAVEEELPQMIEAAAAAVLVDIGQELLQSHQEIIQYK